MKLSFVVPCYRSENTIKTVEIGRASCRERV